MWCSHSIEVDRCDFVEEFALMQDSDEIASYQAAQAVPGDGKASDFLSIVLETLNFVQDLREKLCDQQGNTCRERGGRSLPVPRARRPSRCHRTSALPCSSLAQLHGAFLHQDLFPSLRSRVSPCRDRKSVV